MEALIVILLVAVPIICAIACAKIADRKGRSVPLWAILGLLFGVIPLIVVALLQDASGPQTTRTS